VKSTGTRDVREARLFRGAVALEWFKILNLIKPQRDRGSKVEQILNELHLCVSPATQTLRRQ
jgi:hypothetical protein